MGPGGRRAQNLPHLRSSVQETNESCVRLLNEQPKLFVQKVHPHARASSCASRGFLSSFLMNPSMALKLHYGRTSTTTTASESLRNQTGKGATELAIPKTIHIAHVLEQYIRGYLCGSNTKRWKNHLFAKKSDPSANNVTKYFYRFEFRKRGTLHAHILIWLDDINNVNVTKLSATIPWGNVQEAFLVYDLQKSRTSSLPLRQVPNRVLTENNETYLAFHHSRTDKDCNLRAFVPAVTGSLQCSMDVQSSDGKAMLLKYVTSYVAKCHDAVKTQQLYSVDLGTYQAATSFLKNMHPLEPEMVL